MAALRLKYFLFGDQQPKDGVNKKLLSQVSELIHLGLDIELVLANIGDAQHPSYDFLTLHVVDEHPVKNIFGLIRHARRISRIFSETMGSLGPDDILYYRYSGPFPLYYPYNYLRRFRRCKIVTEHQTKELEEFKLNGNAFSYWSEFFFGGMLRKQSDAIIGVTDEVTQYEIACSGDPVKPHLTIGNGFAVKSVPVRQNSFHEVEDLQLLCVANISRWHGLDRLLQGIATYSGTPRVRLYVAGNGPELSHLQKLAGDLNITDLVAFNGFLTGEALDTLFDQCHIAVGSLGIHRKGLTQTSELKGREYCARGIPYIVACADPDFPPDFPYILRLPADENPIDVERILTFAKEICADPDHPQKMRRYAEEHLDWSVKMKKLKGFLEMLVGRVKVTTP